MVLTQSQSLFSAVTIFKQRRKVFIQFASFNKLKCVFSSSVAPLIPQIVGFDFETTELATDTARIIQVAAADVKGGSISKFESLVNPQREIQWRASETTKIYNHNVNKADIPEWNIVGRAFVDFVNSRQSSPDCPVVLVAHNGKRFDVPILLKESQRCEIPIPSNWLYLDSYWFFKHLFNEKGKALNIPTPENFKLLNLHQDYFKFPSRGEAHRALTDVEMLLDVLNKMIVLFNVTSSDFMDHTFTAQTILERKSNPKVKKIEVGIQLRDETVINVREVKSISEESFTWKPKIIRKEEENKEEEEAVIANKSNITEEYLGQSSKRRPTKTNSNRGKKGMTFRDPWMEKLEDKSKEVEEIVDQYLNVGKPNLLDSATLQKIWREEKTKNEDFLVFLEVEDRLETFCEDCLLISSEIGISTFYYEDEINKFEIPKGLKEQIFQKLLSRGYSLLVSTKSSSNNEDLKYKTKDRLTPGTTVDPLLLSPKLNNFVLFCTGSESKGEFGIAFADVSTGEFYEHEAILEFSVLKEKVLLVDPSEIVLLKEEVDHFSDVIATWQSSSSRWSQGQQKYSKPMTICQIEEDKVLPVKERAKICLSRYIKEISGTSPKLPIWQNISLKTAQTNNYTLNYLKILPFPGSTSPSLYNMYHTCTVMGARRLHFWLKFPFVDRVEIERRHSGIQVILDSNRDCIVRFLKKLPDLERIATRIQRGEIHEGDKVTLASALNLLGTSEAGDLFKLNVFPQETFSKIYPHIKVNDLTETELGKILEIGRCLSEVDVLYSFSELVRTGQGHLPIIEQGIMEDFQFSENSWMVQVGSPAPIFSEEVPIFESLMLSKNSSPKRQSFDSFKGSSDWLLEKTELKRIEETWEKVVLVLEREPVTKSLVQQKGILLSADKLPSGFWVKIGVRKQYVLHFQKAHHASKLLSALQQVLGSNSVEVELVEL